MDMNASAGEVEEKDTAIGQDMPVGVKQAEFQVGQDTQVGQLIHPTQFRKGLRSQIRLGEEIT